MNLRAFSKLTFVMVSASLLTACAPLISGAMNVASTTDTLHAKTASYLGVKESQLVLSSVEKGLLSTTYKAQVGSHRYNCSMYYGDVDCKQIPGYAQQTEHRHKSSGATGRMSNMEAQTRLNQLGFNVGTPDGIVGKNTVAQLKKFQASRGLPETGRLDNATMQELQ